MKLDEFAFLNQQLAGMLRAGIPLEGSLRELSSTMRRGKLRREMEALQADLAAGVPFAEAVQKRELPDLYVRLTQAGVSGGDLPGVLTLLADYYSRLSGIMTRLRGLMVYPLIVLLASLGVSLLITLVYRSVILGVFEDLASITAPFGKSLTLIPGIWLPVVILATLTVIWLGVMFTPRLRHWARWKLPGFREASIAQLSAAASLLMQCGATLQGTLGLLRNTEGSTPAGREIDRWINLHRQGEAKWTSFTAGSRVFPPLFIWLVAQGGENMAQGFQRASEIYHARSTHKIDLLLYAALPMSIIGLALLIVGQIYPALMTLRQVFTALGL